MRTATDNYLHNPFQNRFNDPVTQRRDEMQAHANVMWLRERNEASREREAIDSSRLPTAKLSGRLFAGLFSLLLIVLVSVVVLKIF